MLKILKNLHYSPRLFLGSGKFTYVNYVIYWHPLFDTKDPFWNHIVYWKIIFIWATLISKIRQFKYFICYNCGCSLLLQIFLMPLSSLRCEQVIKYLLQLKAIEQQKSIKPIKKFFSALNKNVCLFRDSLIEYPVPAPAALEAHNT